MHCAESKGDQDLDEGRGDGEAFYDRKERKEKRQGCQEGDAALANAADTVASHEHGKRPATCHSRGPEIKLRL